MCECVCPHVPECLSVYVSVGGCLSSEMKYVRVYSTSEQQNAHMLIYFGLRD